MSAHLHGEKKSLECSPCKTKLNFFPFSRFFFLSFCRQRPTHFVARGLKLSSPKVRMRSKVPVRSAISSTCALDSVISSSYRVNA